MACLRFTKLRRRRSMRPLHMYYQYLIRVLDFNCVKLLDLHGTRYEQGYDYGYLTAAEIVDTYNMFAGHFLPPKFLDEVFGCKY